MREEFETLLCAIGREEWLIFEEDEEGPRNDGDSDRAAAAAATEDDNAAAADDDSVASNLISNIDLQTIREDFLRDLVDKSLDEETIRGIIRRHKNSKPNAAIGTLRNQLKAWAEQSSKLHQKYHWYLVAQLKQRIKQIDLQANTAGAKAVLLNTLVDCKRKQSERDEAIANGDVSRCFCCCCWFCLLCL